MKKLRKPWRMRGVYVYPGRYALDLGVYRLWAATSQQQAGNGQAGATKLDNLLLADMEQANDWARLAFQLYVGWFALQFIVNGAAMGLLFNYREPPVSKLALLIFVMFILWNLMGVIGALLVRKILREADVRSTDVTKRLSKHQGSEDDCPAPQSPVPRRAIDPVLIVCSVVSLLSLALWTIVLIKYWP
jgi:hypothetical protein